MDLTTVPRILAKLEYSAVRLPIACLDEYVLAHYWDEDAPPRSDVRHFLGSLDEVAGWLLADDEIARRGETLLRRTRAPEPAGAPGAGTPTSTPQADTPPASEPPAGEPPAGEPPRAAPPEAWSAGEATDATTAAADPVAPDQAREDTADQAREDTADQAREDTADQAREDTSATAASTVDVAFTLPADVDADSVALCGDFNDWSAGATALERGDDGTWQVSIPLKPGRRYRYRYLLDGERWENGQAGPYEPNPYGSVDSVIAVD